MAPIIFDIIHVNPELDSFLTLRNLGITEAEFRAASWGRPALLSASWTEEGRRVEEGAEGKRVEEGFEEGGQCAGESLEEGGQGAGESLEEGGPGVEEGAEEGVKKGSKELRTEASSL